MSLAGLFALSSCEVQEGAYDSHSNHSGHHGGSHHDGDRNHNSQTRVPRITELSNGNFLATFEGGGSASFNKDGRMMAQNGISRKEEDLTQSLINLRVRNRDR
ncbi:hypothetical protein SAMN02745181_0589 [Rubritalea squalenifaciens DSM 18772]|uniref:Uncharacterized protein n=2 Tax=Rubritalea squalenifaciens TaxID=407226 RepID=A0A1M6CWY6_9BACT|nr:hypothetical protein SAMN02745181_0589 [Rubritalea squalenifaciens DSM 18772]